MKYKIEDNRLIFYTIRIIFDDQSPDQFVTDIREAIKIHKTSKCRIEKIDISKVKRINGSYVESEEQAKIFIENCLRTEYSFPYEEYRERLINDLSLACNQTITAGITVLTSKGTKRFSLESHDQSQLMNLKPLLDAHIDQIPYHANGEIAEVWDYDDFNLIYTTAMKHIQYHSNYYNHLKQWIKSANKEELLEMEYGTPLPEDLQISLNKILELYDQTI